MPIKSDIVDLIHAHQELDEPMDGAVWLNQQSPEAWLLEVVPDIPEAAKPFPAFVFGPSSDFRYPLNLVAGPVKALERAIRLHADLAAFVARGEIIADSEAVRRLIALAREVTSGR